MSDIVNAAVEQALAEDAEDLKAFKARKHEAEFAFDDVVNLLNRNSVD